MSRPQSDDLLQSFMFRISDTESFLDEQAGFNSVTTPEVSTEAVEYRTGNRKYTIKQAGVPTVEAVTMQKGIARTETDFADWMMERVLGGQPYRSDIMINQYTQEAPGYSEDDEPQRQQICKDAFPTRVKLMGDLDATSSDVNIQELECAVEEVVLQKS
jgi:phage tail-like protein